jgi:hypothetical protein
MHASIEKIRNRIEPLRQAIIHHKAYSAIKDLESLRCFMQYHVYAVWDFMSLLKSLQNRLTCTAVPWFPEHNAETRYLINEIVVGEESDVYLDGSRMSHFELYLMAMQQCGANTQEINTFIDTLRQTKDFPKAFEAARSPEAARKFVDFTFEVIASGKDYLQAAVFTFGREDLIPEMFLAIIQDIAQDFPDEVAVFKYYLERHIEVDGEHHSHLAIKMLENLCGDDPMRWQEAETAIVEALEKRIELWNGVYEEILQSESVANFL